jgi:hypothetical protein
LIRLVGSQDEESNGDAVYTDETTIEGTHDDGESMAAPETGISAGPEPCVDECRYGSCEAGESDVEYVDLDGLSPFLPYPSDLENIFLDL